MNLIIPLLCLLVVKTAEAMLCYAKFNNEKKVKCDEGQICMLVGCIYVYLHADWLDFIDLYADWLDLY